MRKRGTSRQQVSVRLSVRHTHVLHPNGYKHFLGQVAPLFYSFNSKVQELNKRGPENSQFSANILPSLENGTR